MEIGYSISAGRPAYDHVVRNTISPNVDKSAIQDDVVLVDEVQGRNVREYLDELLQPAIDEYNATHRKDRQIDMTYTEWHKSQGNKGDLFFEYVLQFGDGETLGREYYQAAKDAAENPGDKELQQRKEDMKKVFVDMYTEWKNELEKCGFKVAYASIHFDEGFKEVNGKEVCGTPHLHAGVVPIPEYDFKRGPKKQISMSKMLEEHGFNRVEKLKDAKIDENQKHLFQQGRFFVKFREYQERTLQRKGFEPKRQELIRRPHQTVDLYIATQSAKMELQEAERRRDDAIRQQEEAKLVTEREQRRAKSAITSASNLERRKEAIEDLTHEAERELSFVQKKIDVAVEDGQNKVARAEHKAQELINEAEKIKAQAIATEQNLIIERQMQRMLASAYQERKKGFRGTVTLPYEEYQDMYLAYTMREESKSVLKRGIAMQSKAEAQKRDIADFNMQKRILNQKEATLDERIEKAFKQGERSGQQMILKDICATLNRSGLEDISKQLCRIYDEILNPDKEMRLQGISEHDKDTHDRDDSPELGD